MPDAVTTDCRNCRALRESSHMLAESNQCLLNRNAELESRVADLAAALDAYRERDRSAASALRSAGPQGVGV